MLPSDDFTAFLTCLKNRYQKFQLPHILLEEKLNRIGLAIDVNELGCLAKEAYFKAHVGKGLDPSESRFSLEAFKNVALHAVAVLQQEAVALFSEGSNNKGYMLLVSDNDIQWAEWRAGIEEFIKDQQSQPAR